MILCSYIVYMSCCEILIHKSLFKHVAAGAMRPKVHITHDDMPSIKGWVDGTLKTEIASMGFELAHKIAGRTRIAEVIRMINEGHKIIMVFTKEEISNHFSTELIYALSEQNINKTTVIPILLNCKLDDLSDEIKQYLSPYTVLKHDELDDHLQQSLIA